MLIAGGVDERRNEHNGTRVLCDFVRLLTLHGLVLGAGEDPGRVVCTYRHELERLCALTDGDRYRAFAELVECLATRPLSLRVSARGVVLCESAIRGYQLEIPRSSATGEATEIFRRSAVERGMLRARHSLRGASEWHGTEESTWLSTQTEWRTAATRALRLTLVATASTFPETALEIAVCVQWAVRAVEAKGAGSERSLATLQGLESLERETTAVCGRVGHLPPSSSRES